MVTITKNKLLKCVLFQRHYVLQNTLASISAGPNGFLHPCTRPESAATARTFSTMRTSQPGSLPEYQVDPYQLLEDELKDVYSYIKQVK